MCGGIIRGKGTDKKGNPLTKRPCRRMAGHGTDHPGVGRCKYHGGCVPRKHGLYSSVMPEEFRAGYEASLEDPNYKSMREHLSVLDHFILPAAIARGVRRPGTPGVPDPLDTQMQAIDIKSKVLKRMADIEDRGKIKMTEKELAQFVLEIVKVVSEYVDAPTLRKIADRFGVRAMAARPISVGPA